jgi:acyl dehydratase
VFAIQPFSAACSDPALALNVLRLVHSEQDFEFFLPVHPGDVLETTGEITRVKERGPLDFLAVTTETLNQRDELVVRGVWTAIVRNADGLRLMRGKG